MVLRLCIAKFCHQWSNRVRCQTPARSPANGRSPTATRQPTACRRPPMNQLINGSRNHLTTPWIVDSINSLIHKSMSYLRTWTWECTGKPSKTCGCALPSMVLRLCIAKFCHQYDNIIAMPNVRPLARPPTAAAHPQHASPPPAAAAANDSID